MPVHRHPEFFNALPVEVAEHYEPGGYHPVNIGDTFNQGRYRVLNKLARGGNSTIWLVEDTLLNHLASLKVLTADASSRTSELEISQYLQDQQKLDDSHPGKAHVVTIIDTFTHTGPNGDHHCIVTELLGANLASDPPSGCYGPGIKYHPSQVTTKAATQVALGLAYLHKCGIVHGNLNLGHVLFHSSELQNASPAEQTRIYGEVEEIPVVYEWDNEPPVCKSNPPDKIIYAPFRRAVFAACLNPPDAVHIKICDFGQSSLCNSSPQASPAPTSPPWLDLPLIQFDMPYVYSAPEVLFEDIESLNYSMDIWAYGVLLHMIMNDKRGPFSDRNIGDLNNMIAFMIITLGILPEHWSKRWTVLSQYFKKEYLRRVPYIRMWITSKDMDIADEEITVFEKVLLSIFRYQPEQRNSPEDVHSAAVPIETAEHYEPGGYHPINVGDTFNNGRYRILNKLGLGENSTIWLVEDTVLNRLASLKVLTADVSSQSPELEISRYLQTKQKQYDTHPGKAHVFTIISTFVLEGPNGFHHCIVTEVLGINLEEELPLDYYEPDTGGTYHPLQCGIVHGNLHLGHVLFHSSKLQNASPAERLRIYGEVKEIPIEYYWSGPPPCKSNYPENAVYVPFRKAVFDACLIPHDGVHIKICDFGHSSLRHSTSVRKSPLDLETSFLVYRAPEIIFNDIRSPNPSTDIWAYGVLLFMIMNDKLCPFPDGGEWDEVGDTIYGFNYWESSTQMVQQMKSALGIL